MLKYDAILFDLDGTLLPMDLDEFIHTYFGLLAKTMAPHGFDPKALVASVWKGTNAMIANDGSMINSELFWKLFREEYGEEIMEAMPLFDDFYKTEFLKSRAVCGFNPEVGGLIEALKARGDRLVLATSPLYPASAVESRIEWSGCSVDDFEHITHYENCRYTKPSKEYYTEIMTRLGLEPSRCLMVGNDVIEDGAALDAGLDFFLLTDCLINKNNEDLSRFNHGGMPELKAFLEL